MPVFLVPWAWGAAATGLAGISAWFASKWYHEDVQAAQDQHDVDLHQIESNERVETEFGKKVMIVGLASLGAVLLANAARGKR